MGDWFFNLSVGWMALVIFLATYLIAWIVDLVVTRPRSKKRTSQGLQGGFACNATPIGYPFRAAGRIHRRRRLGQFRQSKDCSYGPRPARFGLSFYSPEVFPNRGRGFMRWSTVT